MKRFLSLLMLVGVVLVWNILGCLVTIFFFKVGAGKNLTWAYALGLWWVVTVLACCVAVWRSLRRKKRVLEILCKHSPREMTGLELGQQVGRGLVYIALSQLQQQGLVESREDDAMMPEDLIKRGGIRRRLYRATPKALQVIQ